MIPQEISSKIRDKITKLVDLPSLPVVISNLLYLIESQTTSAKDLSEALDQSLAAKVLKLANSAFYGSQRFRTISTIEQAVIIVGFNAIRDIALSASFFSVFPSEHTTSLDKNEFWQHSITTALITKVYASIFDDVEHNSAYSAGLFHDLGKIVLDEYFHDHYRDVLSAWEGRKSDPNARFFEVEREVLGIDHAEAGALLAERWNIPDVIITSIRFHHLALSPRQGLPYLVGLADRFSSSIDIVDTSLADDRDIVFPWEIPEVKAVIDAQGIVLTEPKIERISKEFVGELAKCKELLALALA